MEKEHKQYDKEFSVEKVIEYTGQLLRKYEQTKEIAFDQFFRIMLQFCKCFKLLNTFLGIAFSDVTDKVRVMSENNKRYQGHPGFFSFIKMQMGLKIQMYNGGNNKELKAPKQYLKYDSTGRNLLRLMWLLTFIKIAFEGMKNPKESMSHILCRAYDTAFGEKHAWVIRKGAKLAIKASTDRKQFVQVITGQKYDENLFAEINERFLTRFIPIYDALWGFYKENKLQDLP